MSLRVLHVTNIFPDPEHPVRGIFVKEQIDSLTPLLEVNDVHVLDRSALPVLRYWRSVPAVRAAAVGYDVVHAHHVLTGLVCLLAGVRKRLIVSFMNEYGRNILRVPSFVSALLERIVHRFAAGAVFKVPFPLPDRASRDALIPNGTDLEFFAPSDQSLARARLGIASDSLVLLFVSANDLHRPSKRYDRFLDVLSVVRAARPETVALTMVTVERSETPFYYSAANALVVTSEHEGSPNSVKEALASGLPVVSTAVGDVRTLLQDVPNCECFDRFDAATFASAVVAAVATPDRAATRSAFAAKGLARALVANRILSLYHSAVPCR